MRQEKAARIGIVGATVLVIALLVGGWLLLSSLNVTLPDVNPSSQTGPGGTQQKATSYADIQVTVTIAGTQLPIGGGNINLAPGGFSLKIHEVLAPTTGPVTVFAPGGLTTFGENCFAKVTMYFTTPDYSGHADSEETQFHLDTPVLFHYGHMNMYQKGTITLTFDVYAKDCGAIITSQGGYVKIATINAVSFLFDGVDNFK